MYGQDNYAVPLEQGETLTDQQLPPPPPTPPIHPQQGSPAVVSRGCSLPAESDMEMEDDITLSDGGQEVHNSSDALNRKSDVKGKLHGAQSSTGLAASQGVSCENGSSVEKAPFRIDIYSIEASQFPLASKRDKSPICIADDQNTLGDSAAAEAIDSDGLFNQITTDNSPFRLLQDYASETSSENGPNADANVVIAPSSVTASATSSHEDAGSPFEIGSNSPRMNDKMSGLQYESRRSKISLDRKKDAKDRGTTLIIESHEAIQGKDVSKGATIDTVSKRDKSPEGKKTKSESVLAKVDEYGRLVREGSTESNSDGSHYNKRRKRGCSRSHIRSRSRSRSRSRNRSRIRSRSHSRSCSRSPIRSRRRSRSYSRSPIDSRRRRSPRRRREKRNRSPSWSSRKQRNSRSPTYRRAGDFRDENKRQDRCHIPECFDYLRGRCSRGGFCRYMHRSHDQNDGSWCNRSKQTHLEVPSSVKNSKIKEEIEDGSGIYLHGEIKGQERQLRQNMGTKDGQFIDQDNSDSESARVTAATMQVKQNFQVKSEETIVHNPESQQMKASLLSDSAPDRAFKTSPSKGSSIEPATDAILLTHSHPTECPNAQQLPSGQLSSQFPSFSAATSPYPSQLPPPPLPPLSQGTSFAHMPQYRDYNQRPHYPAQSVPTGINYPYQGPLPNQPAQFSVSQDSPWTSLPPPPPRPPYDSSLNAGTAALGASSQFQQNHLAPRSDFGSQSSMRPYGPYPTAPPHSKSDFPHQMYPTLSELPHPPPNREDLGSGNPSNQPFAGSGHTREERFTHAPVQDVNLSGSFGQEHLQPQPAPSSYELTRTQKPNFSGDNFPSGELLNSSSQTLPHSHNQQRPSYGVQFTAGDSILGVPGSTGAQYPVGGSILGFLGKDGPMSRYPQDMSDTTQFPQVPDYGASRIQIHHNPYAATFEQPLSSKFSSNILIQEKNAAGANMVDTTVQVPVDGQGVGSTGSRQTTSSPSSARAVGQLLPKSDCQKYDPLFDSIEPSGNKYDQMRLSGSCEPLDVEEINKHTEVGPVASATSLDYDGYGEAADAGVGVVEDESLSNDDGTGNMAVGEMEIDQVKSGGKSKKKKDSRSTRVFKSAVADFVKDLLKPSWRQGNMSKEAFKTIVKKTVDKVSGAMKSHQIPKSEAKINHYIDSSQRKLTKLVMGYVDKYVKV